MDFIQKKPGTTTDLQDPDALVSTEQTTQPLLRDANGNQERNSRISINDVGPRIVGMNDQIRILWPTLRDENLIS